MKSVLSIPAALLLATASASAQSQAASPLDLSAGFWVDTGYMMRDSPLEPQEQIANYMQGRLVIGAAYTARRDAYYATGKLELMGLVNEFAKSQYEPHALDVYLRVGEPRWDVTVGRLLAWEVYDRGQGIELYTAEEAGARGAPPLYLLDFTRGYKNEAGQAAIHAYPFPWLGIELAGVYGQENNQNCVGVRPVVDVKVAGLQLVAGYEILKQVPQIEADKLEVTSQGFAGRMQYRLPIVTLGVDGSRATIESTDIQGDMDTDKTLTRYSLGGWVDVDFWRNSIGLGYHRTNQTNEQDEHNTHDQMFATYLVRLPIEGLSLKAVYGYARGHLEDNDAGGDWTNTMHSFRVRAQFELR